jgi:hypothetical protein
MPFSFNFVFFILQCAFFNGLQHLSPHPDGNVRAHFSAKGASGTGLFIVPAGVEKSLTIHLFSDPNQLLRAGDRAKSTALASLAINFNLGHDKKS